MRTPKDRAAALVEFAIIAPVLFLVIIGGLILGLATVEHLRIERAATDAARLSEPDARTLIEGAGGTLVCYSEEGECFDDGLNIERVQIIARGRTWLYPTGSVTPTSQVSRPKEADNVDETVDE